MKESKDDPQNGVELKALARLSSIEEAQIINYMKIANCNIALQLNFGAPRLEYNA